MSSINFLVGSSSYCFEPFKPFSNTVLNFLETFSKELNTIKEIRYYPDLKALSFWCRKKNIIKMKNHFMNSSNQLGLGLIFHVTPSNIPTNFVYSLFFGLLSGNSNIVKVPSKNFEQIKIICKILKKILNKDSSFLEKKITIIKYNNNDKITKKFSMLCDARLIWGSDKTINDIKSFKTHEKNLDLVFGDRYSFCIIDQSKVSQLTDFELKNLAQKFYNDTFLVDQNACSSPHLIIWTGKKNKNSKERFWNSVYNIAKLKYNLTDSAPLEKYNDLCKHIINIKNIINVKTYDNLIYIIRLNKLTNNNHNFRGKWGLFFEYELKNLNNIKKFVNIKYQTLTYFGVDKNKLKNFVIKNNLKGIDRIVPIGQSLNISLLWDGFNIPTILSREIEIQ